MIVELAPRVVVDPRVRFGKLVLQGTRVPFELVVGKLLGECLRTRSPTNMRLQLEDIRAALGYAAQVLAGEEVRGVA